jgi:hypothetical protein
VVLSRDSPAILEFTKACLRTAPLAGAGKLAITFLETAMDGMDVNAVLHVERVLYAAERLECDLMAFAACRRGEPRGGQASAFREYIIVHSAQLQVAGHGSARPRPYVQL